jgi:transcription elongation factor Elf1
MFWDKKQEEPTTTIDYEFNCPHCKEKNSISIKTTAMMVLRGFACQHCEQPLIRGMHPYCGLCVYPVFKMKRVK